MAAWLNLGEARVRRLWRLLGLNIPRRRPSADERGNGESGIGNRNSALRCVPARKASFHRTLAPTIPHSPFPIPGVKHHGCKRHSFR